MGRGESKINTKFTKSQLDAMNRTQLEKVAISVFMKKNPALSDSEAVYRARSLMSGNTTAQLKKYIKKNG